MFRHAKMSNRLIELSAAGRVLYAVLLSCLLWAAIHWATLLP